MIFFLIDSNVLIDILTRDARWYEWSRAAINRLMGSGHPALNPIILAEIAPRFRDLAELEESLPENVIHRLDLPWEAAFLAGKAYLAYRRAGGQRTSPLPDFYIGAHAQVSGLTLVTRDATRYRTYFPDVQLVAP